MSTFKSLTLSVAIVAGAMAFSVSSGLAQEGNDPGGPVAAFGDIDADKDGAISIAEVLDYQGAAFAAFDEDKDGSLTVAEYVGTRLGANALGFFAPKSFELKSDHFELWNRNGDNALSEAEFAAGGLAAFAAIDPNGDSKLDEGEFAARLAQ